MASLPEPLQWNEALLSLYDLNGPRYTSYPTAPRFSEDFSFADLRRAIARSNGSGAPLSLYCHLPFCDTLCFYCGCNKVVTHNKGRARPYLNRLEREMAMQAELFDTNRPVTQLHWGGGTPTFIDREEMTWLMAATRRHYRLLDDDSGEYGIEIHPGRVTPDILAHLRELGFNRISMGVQDFDPRVQQAVNRYNSVEEVRELVRLSRGLHYHSLSMDLIYGLPLQTVASVADTLDRVIELSPDRLSFFNYAHMPRLFKSQALIREANLPPPQEKIRILQMAIERLQQAGYVYIGMDHFAKPGDSLVKAQASGGLQRNFQGYSTHGDCDLLSFGVSSISAFGDVYVQNAKQLTRYQFLIDEGQLPFVRGFTLSEEDRLRRYVINQLICHFRLDFAGLDARYGITARDYFARELGELSVMAEDGLVEITNGGIRVNSGGRLLIRRICMVFDAYLSRDNWRVDNRIQYSKVI